MNLILPLFILLTLPSYTNAIHSLRRPSSRSNISSATQDEYYDKRITQINTQGRLLQLEYATQATKIRHVCLPTACFQWDNFIIIAFPSSSTATATTTTTDDDYDRSKHNIHPNNGHVDTNSISSHIMSSTSPTREKIHRINDNLLAISTGLSGDNRLLISHLRSISNHYSSFYESVSSFIPSPKIHNQQQQQNYHHSSSRNRIPVETIATICAQKQHQFTITPGARCLASNIIFVGFTHASSSSFPTTTTTTTTNDVTHDSNPLKECELYQESQQQQPQQRCRRKLGIYQSEPGGTLSKCHFATSGYGCEILLNDLDHLWNDLNSGLNTNTNNNNNDNDNDKHTVKLDGSPTTTTLEYIIHRLGNIMFDCMKRESDTFITPTKTSSTAATTTNPREENSSKQNHHNYSHHHHDNNNNDEIDLYIIHPNPKYRGGIQISCAKCVKKSQLIQVGQYFQSDFESFSK